MKPEELLEAMLDYGIFTSLGEDDYGRTVYPIGEEDIGGLSGDLFDKKWPEVTEEVLIKELKKFVASR